MKNIKYKKGQLAAISDMVPPIIGVGLLIVISFLIFSQLNDQSIDQISTTNTNNIENVTSWTAFIYAPLTVDAAELTCDAVYNTTNGTRDATTLISSAYYTCNEGGIAIINDTAGAFNSSIWVNFSYKQSSAAVNGTRDVQNATQDIVGWIPLIILITLGAIVLGLIFFFGRVSRVM